MIVAFGTSTPTSMTVVATRTSTSRALKLAMTLRRSAARRRPCRQPTRYPRSSARRSRPPPPPRHARRATRGLDERTHDVGLPAVIEVPAQARVCLRAAILGDPRRDDRLAVGRRKCESLTSRSPYTVSASVRGIGVAERCNTCGLCPSTRAVRCATPTRCCSSTTATARSEKSTSFSMRACVPTTICASPEAMSCRTIACSLARRELVRSATRTPSGAHSFVEGEEVLLREGLRRRHERSLPPALDRAKERMERDDRLP